MEAVEASKNRLKCCGSTLELMEVRRSQWKEILGSLHGNFHGHFHDTFTKAFNTKFSWKLEAGSFHGSGRSFHRSGRSFHGSH